MHKSYQSVLPTSNKLLQQKWDQKYYDEHRRMVRDQKSMVDTKPPRTYMHLHLKLKKLQLEEERLATIERDNRILLEKMSNIMRTKGRVDNHNDYEYKSLNKEKRMREMLRVAKENQEILKRIMQRKPEYSHEEWQRQWDENQKFMDSISTYPKDWWKEEEGKEKKKTTQRQNSDSDSLSSSRSQRSGTSRQEEKKKTKEKEEKKGTKAQQEDDDEETQKEQEEDQ